MTLDDIVAKGWTDHAADAPAVMDTLPEAVRLAETPADMAKVAGLVLHVAGEHLGRWDAGIALLERLRLHPAFDPETPECKSACRSLAVLCHAGGRVEEAEAAQRAGLSGGSVPEAADRARVQALLAAALAGQGRIAEAGAALRAALGYVASYPSGKDDPAARVLAVTGNNLAAELEARKQRTPEERQLMLEAAQVGLDFWSRVGGWMEIERAHYRLAMSHIAAGQPDRAAEHAARCLAIVRENGADPGEEFFAHEVVARARIGCGDRQAAIAAAEDAESVLARVDDASFRDDCASALGKLRQDLAG